MLPSPSLLSINLRTYSSHPSRYYGGQSLRPLWLQASLPSLLGESWNAIEIPDDDDDENEHPRMYPTQTVPVMHPKYAAQYVAIHVLPCLEPSPSRPLDWCRTIHLGTRQLDNQRNCLLLGSVVKERHCAVPHKTLLCFEKTMRPCHSRSFFPYSCRMTRMMIDPAVMPACAPKAVAGPALVTHSIWMNVAMNPDQFLLAVTHAPTSPEPSG